MLNLPGMELANVLGSVFGLSHLYNMAKHETSGDMVCEDMEYLFARNGEDHLFYGERPKSSREYMKKYTLALGISAHMSAPDYRGKHMVSSRGFVAATRLLRSNCIKSNALMRYDAFKVYFKMHAAKSADIDCIQILMAFQRGQAPAGLIQQEVQGSFFVPLLECVASGVADEQHHLNFSYSQMHYRC